MDENCSLVPNNKQGQGEDLRSNHSKGKVDEVYFYAEHDEV